MEWGLVNAVVPMTELDAEVARWCDELLAVSPTCLKVYKASFVEEFEDLLGQTDFLRRWLIPQEFWGERAEGRNERLSREAPAGLFALPANDRSDSEKRARVSAETYDFIVIGLGYTGGVVAARLSENGKYRVLCPEAGDKGSDYIWTRPPAGTVFSGRQPKGQLVQFLSAARGTTRWPWSTIGCEYEAWMECGSPTHRSCRRCRPAIPTSPAS